MVHYEVERLVEFYHPPAWTVLVREETGHPRRFRDVEAADRAARRLSGTGPRRVVLVRDDGGREILDPTSPDLVQESSRRSWRDIVRRLTGSSR